MENTNQELREMLSAVIKAHEQAEARYGVAGSSKAREELATTIQRARELVG